MERRIGAVEPHRFPERIGRIANELEARGQLGQPPEIGGGSGVASEPRHRRLQYPVQRRVLGQLVAAAGETVRPHGKMGELALDVEPAAQQRQVFLMREVTTRHPSSDGGEQALCEQPDQELEQVIALGVQGRQLAFGHPQIRRHGEHADERCAYGTIFPVDLGQDFDGATWNGEDADNLSGLETLVSAGEDGGFRQPQALSRAFGGGVES